MFIFILFSSVIFHFMMGAMEVLLSIEILQGKKKAVVYICILLDNFNKTRKSRGVRDGGV